MKCLQTIDKLFRLIEVSISRLPIIILEGSYSLVEKLA